jgi:4-hydroxy-tetrahydrodipicolinate reductase
MVNGIPGNVARIVAGRIRRDPRFALVPASFTGPEIAADEHSVDDVAVRLIRPDAREAALSDLRRAHGRFLTVDYTHPSAVNANAEFYCRHELPFVMGTTGGDRRRLEETILASSIPAVVAPNMAKQIVGFQAMMDYAARTFPGLFAGYTLTVRESHQKGKADTSGTAKAMVDCFNRLGVPFTADAIRMERDPQVQRDQWGVPEPFLAGHAWHTYTLVSPDGSATFEFTHNVNGRDIYVHGTLDALVFLSARLEAGVRGRMFSMIDVLQGA